MNVFHKLWRLEVKTRGATDVEFDKPGYRLPATELPGYVTQGIPLELSVTITAQHTYAEWGRAYARQGAADLSVYRELSTLRVAGRIEDCHEVHYMQMAVEKIARAYMLKHAKGDRTRYLESHVVVKEFVQAYAASPEWSRRFRDKSPLWPQVKQLAGAIEDLAPAVERQARPSNAEYPWSDGLTLTVPKDVQFRQRLPVAPSVWTELAEILDEIGGALST